VHRGKCPAGTCTTVSWNTSPGSAGCEEPDASPPGGQCRHQGICIQGRGETILTCETEDCEIDCGTETTLTLCTTGGAPEFTFNLLECATAACVVADGTVIDPDEEDPFEDDDGNICHTYTVGPLSGDTTFKGTVTDGTGCAKDDSVTVTTADITPVITINEADACSGVLTISAVSGGVACGTVAWEIDGVAAAASNTDIKKVVINANGTLTYRWLDGVCHTITANATCGDCPGTASTTLEQCVGTTKRDTCPVDPPEENPFSATTERGGKQGGKQDQLDALEAGKQGGQGGQGGGGKPEKAEERGGGGKPEKAEERGGGGKPEKAEKQQGGGGKPEKAEERGGGGKPEKAEKQKG
jgi:hypothetical protein